jgi:transcriptional regulator GlxA family with amidase domain
MRLVGLATAAWDTAMGSPRRPVEIAILVYPQAQLSAVHGLTDLFAVATRLGDGKVATSIRVTHWRRDDDQIRPERVDSLPGLLGEPDFVILPPSLSAPIGPEAASRFTAWLAQRRASGAVLASVCAGAFLLAETGLLNHRSATTHWSHADALASRFPAIKVQAGKLLVDEGDLVTAGGLMAWTDLGLYLVDRILGPGPMLDTARFMLIDPPGREQSYYAGFSPRRNHGDAMVLAVQAWLEAQTAEVEPEAMADHAGLALDLFSRRFERATGLAPASYDRRLRVSLARDLLAKTDEPVEQVAKTMGFADVGVFARLFTRVIGLSPGAYRRRFEVRAINRPFE